MINPAEIVSAKRSVHEDAKREDRINNNPPAKIVALAVAGNTNARPNAAGLGNQWRFSWDIFF